MANSDMLGFKLISPKSNDKSMQTVFKIKIDEPAPDLLVRVESLLISKPVTLESNESQAGLGP